MSIRIQKYLKVVPVTVSVGTELVEKYNVVRPYSKDELNWPDISDNPKLIEKYNAGVIVETFNSYDNAAWFVASVKLIQPVQDILEAHEEDPFQPRLMVRTPRDLNVALKIMPNKLIAKLQLD